MVSINACYSQYVSGATSVGMCQVLQVSVCVRCYKCRYVSGATSVSMCQVLQVSVCVRCYKC